MWNMFDKLRYNNCVSCKLNKIPRDSSYAKWWRITFLRINLENARKGCAKKEKRKKKEGEKWEKYSCKFIVHNSDSISRATCAGLFFIRIHVYDILIVSEKMKYLLCSDAFAFLKKKFFFCLFNNNVTINTFIQKRNSLRRLYDYTETFKILILFVFIILYSSILPFRNEKYYINQEIYSYFYLPWIEIKIIESSIFLFNYFIPKSPSFL